MTVFPKYNQGFSAFRVFRRRSAFTDFDDIKGSTVASRLGALNELFRGLKPTAIFGSSLRD